MMDWTDRHCRYFHRLMTRRAMLYTEMVTAPAIVHGPKPRLLDYSAAEHPVALQLGGSDPGELAQAVRIARDWRYDEVNLNCGCPSDRVQSGCFGAVLMKTPGLVGECLAAMREASAVEVTVKCRIGVDDQNPEEALPALLQAARDAGIRRVTVHARKAWLQGLSPKENREVPPLDYDLVARMIPAFPDLTICVNGGIGTLDEAEALLARGFAGVMIGRAAYHRPAEILGAADRLIFGDRAPEADPLDIAAGMEDVIAAHLARGGRLIGVTRHLLGLFAGQPGARHWRRALSEMPNGTLGDYRALVAGLMERQAA